MEINFKHYDSIYCLESSSGEVLNKNGHYFEFLQSFDVRREPDGMTIMTASAGLAFSTIAYKARSARKGYRDIPCLSKSILGHFRRLRMNSSGV